VTNHGQSSWGIGSWCSGYGPPRGGRSGVDPGLRGPRTADLFPNLEGRPRPIRVGDEVRPPLDHGQPPNPACKCKGALLPDSRDFGRIQEPMHQERGDQRPVEPEEPEDVEEPDAPPDFEPAPDVLHGDNGLPAETIRAWISTHPIVGADLLWSPLEQWDGGPHVALDR
jgi:hypothetical protein